MQDQDFDVEFEDLQILGGGGGTSDFNELTNRPKYNNNLMTGNTNIPKVPTKTSEITNDANFQTATQVNATIAPVSTKVNAVDTAINKNVVNSINVTASASTDTINLSDGKINIKTGTTSSETIPFPVASATSAGVMNSATYQGLQETTDIANGLLEGAVAVSNLPGTPTQAQLTTAWENATGREELMNRAVIYDVTNQKLWTYYTNTATWYPVTAGGGSVDVQPWTNTQAGIVKGSTTDGQIFAENDGTGSVNGWDEVKTDISNLENAGYQTESQVDTKIATAIAPLEADIDDLETGKQDALTAGTNIDITNNVISATDTTYTAGDNITIENNEISADVPELLGSTGQSTTAGMTQKAITDALAGIEDVQDYVIKGSGAPTTSTVGTVGKLYEDTTNGKLYQCTAVSGSTYTWEEVGGGGGGVNVVQTTGTSTTDVMSQDATTKLIYGNNNYSFAAFIRAGNVTPKNLSGNGALAFGGNTEVSGRGVALGGFGSGIASTTKATADAAVAVGGVGCQVTAIRGVGLGSFLSVTAQDAVAAGSYSKATIKGEFSVGDSADTHLYNGTGYRKITNVYDGENAHDAATYGQIQALEARIAALEAQLGNA